MIRHQTDGQKVKLIAEGKTTTPIELDMKRILDSLPDFKNEKTALQSLVESRGHILLVSPKYHPEVAGNGIEYMWGISDHHFKKMKGKSLTDLERNVKHVLGKELMPIEKVWKCERRARNYMQLYLQLKTNQEVCNKTYTEMEQMRKALKEYRSHRSVDWFDGDWIHNSL